MKPSSHIKFAPTYLPLHTLVGDLLIQEGRNTRMPLPSMPSWPRPIVPAAKPPRPSVLFRRIVQVAPMDLSAAPRLIDQLAANGQVDEAIGEYLDWPIFITAWAELDMARKTYTTPCAWLNRVRNRTWASTSSTHGGYRYAASGLAPGRARLRNTRARWNE